MTYIERVIAQLEKAKDNVLLSEIHPSGLISATGGKIYERINQARAQLREHGLRAGDRAVLIAPNSINWIAADIAIAAEGAISVPLYVRQNPAELAHMIADSMPALVICADETLLATLRGLNGMPPTVLLDQLFTEKTVHEPPRARQSQAPVTILYTSGTSGMSRGVMLSSSNLEFMLDTSTKAFSKLTGVGQGVSRVFHYLPFCFAGSRVMVFTCLLKGHHVLLSMDLSRLLDELKVAAPHYFLNVPALLERIQKRIEERMTANAWLGALYRRAKRAYVSAHSASWLDRVALALANASVFKSIKRHIGSSLRCLICGSAPLQIETQQFFHMLGIPVYQVYGLTETTAIITMDDPDAGVSVGAVGRAIKGCEVKLSHDNELCVRGPNVFSGYWSRDTDTREVIDGDGWFHTGDQAEVDDRGNWRIIGRIKDLLVPSSGHNIAPQPIESQLLATLPSANHVVLVGHAKPFLTAIVSGELTDAQAQSAIDVLNQKQPHYKCIRGVFVTREPFTPDNGLLTANQKLRRTAIEARFHHEIERLYS